MSAKAAANAKELGFVAALKKSWAEYLLLRKQGATISVPIPGQFIQGPNGEKVPKKQDLNIGVSTGQALGGLAGAAGTAALSTIGKAVGGLTAWGLAASLVYETGSLIVSMFTKTGKESEATAAALDKLSDAGRNLKDTLKNISERDPFERLTIDSINARATAFGDLTASISSMISATNAEMDKMEGFDKFINKLKGYVGMDVQSKAAKAFATSVQQSFKAAMPSEKTDSAKAEVEKTLGASITDIDALEKAYLSFGGSASQQVKKVVGSLSSLSKEQQVSAARGVELQNSWKESGKALTAFLTSALPQDNLSKLGQDMMADAAKFDAALKDPIESLVTMKALANDVASLKLFPPEIARQLASYSDELNALSSTAASTITPLTTLDTKIKELTDQKIMWQVALDTNYQGQNTSIENDIAQLGQKIQGLLQEKKYYVDVSAQVKLREAELREVFGNAVKQQFAAGADILSSKISAEWAKASTTVSNTLAGLLGDSRAAISIKAENERRVLNAQADTVKSQLDLIIATNRLATQVELDRLAKEKPAAAQIAAELPQSKEAQKDYKDLLTREETLKQRAANYEKPIKEQMVPGGSKSLTTQFKQGLGGVTREDINFQQQLESGMAQLAGIEAQKTSSIIKESAELLKSTYDLRVKNAARAGSDLQTELDSLDALRLQGKELSQAQMTRETQLQEALANNTFIQQELELNSKIAALAYIKEKLGKGLSQQNKEILDQDRETLDVKDRTVIVNQTDAKLTKIRAGDTKRIADYEKARFEYLQESARIEQDTKSTAGSTQSTVAGIQLENQRTLNLLTQDEYNIRKQLLDETVLKDEADKASFNTALKFQKEIKQAILDVNNASEDPKPDAEERLRLLNLAVVTELDGIEKVKQARLVQLDVMNMYNERQKAYLGIFESSIDKMTDAILEFAKTGKFSFKDLVTSMIAELVRFEIKTRLMNALKPAFTSFVDSFLGSGSNFGATASTQALAAVPLAKGGAFDSGVQKFAQGGTFSNSVVNSPTLFKFAKGTGLMGEAGPEAIMPLKRDSAGKLGVSMQGSNTGNSGKVEVVVNNFGSEKATTKETQDSRGNRKIEVMIGDLSAGEMSRSGSNSQRALQSTYGLQPQLIRR
jgi:hypothetical protein